MKHFDTLKNLLRSEKSELPEEFSWENMSDGIYAQVDQKPNDRKKVLWILLSSLLGIVIVFTLWYNLGSNNNDSIAIKNSSTDVAYLPKENVSPDTDNNNQEISSASISKDVNLNSQNTVTTVTDPKLLTKATDIKNPKNEVAASTSIRTSQNKNTNNTSSNIATNIYSGDEVPVPNIERQSDEVITVLTSDETHQNSNQLVPKETPIVNNETIKTIALLEAPIDKLPTNPVVNTLDKDAIKCTLPYVKTKEAQTIDKAQKAISINASYDMVTWTHLKKAEVSQNSIWHYTSPANGYRLACGVDIPLSSQWTLGVKGQYDQLYSRLYYQNKYLQNRIIKDTVLHYNVHPISGVKTPVMGDITLVDTITRTVQHYNSYRVVSLPITIGYHKQIGAWNYGVNTGASLGYLMEGKGLRYDENQANLFDKYGTGIFDRRTAITGIVSVNIQRQIATHVGLGLQAQLSHQFTSFSTGVANRMAPSAASLGAKVVYYLK